MMPTMPAMASVVTAPVVSPPSHQKSPPFYNFKGLGCLNAAGKYRASVKGGLLVCRGSGDFA